MPSNTLTTAGHFNVELEPIPLPESDELSLPYTEDQFFEVTRTLIGEDGVIPEGTVGSWRTFLPHKAIFLNEKLQQEPAILSIRLGEAPNFTELAFEIHPAPQLELVRKGLLKYLYGGYSKEETDILLKRAESRYTANQRALERSLDSELCATLKQPSSQK